jgi:hypothetical protein
MSSATSPIAVHRWLDLAMLVCTFVVNSNVNNYMSTIICYFLVFQIQVLLGEDLNLRHEIKKSHSKNIVSIDFLGSCGPKKDNQLIFG